MAEWQGIRVAGNELWRVAAFAATALGVFLAWKALQVGVVHLARRWRRRGSRVAAHAVDAAARGSGLLALAVGISQGLRWLELGARAAEWVDAGVRSLFTAAVAVLLWRMVDVLNVWMSLSAAKSARRLNDMLAPLVCKSARTAIVVVALLRGLQNLSDKPITSIIAGLGIGGLAVALASQETIKNFFGSLVILADKPFELGDRIRVDGHDGPVEAVGFRSTRLRTFDGHLVTIPNGELANRTIENVGNRPYIRQVLNLGIAYDTPPDRVERALEIVKECLRDHEGMRPEFPPRAYFNAFNAASLNIQAIYWYHPPDWWAFCAFSERLNLAILRRFREAGIEFAFPTQTVYLAGDPRRPLTVGSVSPPDGPGA
jgi:MscS family membrane protein